MPKVAELTKLPVPERLALIDELWASISEADLPLESALVQEAQARWQELKADPALGVSYEEIKRRLA